MNSCKNYNIVFYGLRKEAKAFIKNNKLIEFDTEDKIIVNGKIVCTLKGYKNEEGLILYFEKEQCEAWSIKKSSIAVFLCLVGSVYKNFITETFWTSEYISKEL
jgi:hypothetical protein